MDEQWRSAQRSNPGGFTDNIRNWIQTVRATGRVPEHFIDDPTVRSAGDRLGWAMLESGIKVIHEFLTRESLYADSPNHPQKQGRRPRLSDGGEHVIIDCGYVEFRWLKAGAVDRVTGSARMTPEEEDEAHSQHIGWVAPSLRRPGRLVQVIGPGIDNAAKEICPDVVWDDSMNGSDPNYWVMRLDFMHGVPLDHFNGVPSLVVRYIYRCPVMRFIDMIARGLSESVPDQVANLITEDPDVFTQ